MLKKISEDEKVLQDFLMLIGDSEGERNSYFPIATLKKFINFPLLKEKEGFVFYHDNRPIFRLFVHTDHELKKGFFSFFACHKEAFEKYFKNIELSFKKIEDWFSERNITEIIGPYFYSSFLPYRFRVDEGKDAYSWEPKQPKYEYDFFKQLGFSDSETYFSNFTDDFSNWEEVGMKARASLLEEGYLIRYLDKEKLQEEIKDIYELILICFKDNHLFKAIPFEIFKELYIEGLLDYDLSISHFTLDPKGKIAAFHFCFKDAEQLVFKSICVHPDYRGKGIFQAGLSETILKAKSLYPDIKRGTPALVHDQNDACKHIALHDGDEKLHIYKLVKKEI